MKNVISKSALSIIVLAMMATVIGLGPSFANQEAAEPDPILQSFERDLNREPTPTAPTNRDSIDEDELYEMVNTIRWTSDELADDPQAESTTENTDEDQETND